MGQMYPQDEFDWVEEDDRFEFGLCLTLIATLDVEAVLEEFNTVNPRTSRAGGAGSAASDDADSHRYAGTVRGWTWVLEELCISAVLPPLPQRLSTVFGTSMTVQRDVNMLSTFLYSRDGELRRQFELGAELDASDPDGLEGYLAEEVGLDWDRRLSAGLCLQAPLAGVVALTAEPIEPSFVERVRVLGTGASQSNCSEL